MLTLKEGFQSYSLTQDQKNVVSCLDNFLNDDEYSVFLLQGYAGTGKTFITTGVTDYLKSKGKTVHLCAPTGKAAKIIQKKTKHDASTIHKTIYSHTDLKEYRTIETSTGSETYKCYYEIAINQNPQNTVYIIDEASMISDIYSEDEFTRFGSGFLLKDIFKHINIDHNDHCKKIIFIGDNAQLPPVGMKFSPALDETYLSKEYGVKIQKYELTEIVRQKNDSDVIQNSLKIRKALKEKTFNELFLTTNKTDIQEVKKEHHISQYLEACDFKINDKAIIIAGSNADVAEYNKAIRKYFFPNQEKICVGDKLMATRNQKVITTEGNLCLISNGDFLQVRKIYNDTENKVITLNNKNKETGKVLENKITLEFKEIQVAFKDMYEKVHFVNAKIIENLLYNLNANLSSDENKALYIDFCMRNPNLERNSEEFKNALFCDLYFNSLQVKFGYAITCHKAQGSEWENVLIQCHTHHKQQLSEDYFRWLYTAITRTTHKLYLFNPPKIDRYQINTDSWFDNMPKPKEINQIEACDCNNLLNNTYGITQNMVISRGILNQVNNAITNHDIKIQSISQSPYKETYFFEKQNDIARIDISYNSKKQITSIVPLKQDILSQNIKDILDGLTGYVVVSSENKNFTEPFLEDFHSAISIATKNNNIDIKNREQLDWNLRYIFSRANQQVVVDIFYNSKKRFTKSNPVRNRCNSSELLSDIEIIIKNELNKS